MLPAHVEVAECPNNDAWVRDTGATFLVRKKGAGDGAGATDAAASSADLPALAGMDWTFNAYGGEVDGIYADWSADDRVAALLCARHKARRFRVPLVLEGGSIHSDGEGTALVTDQCLLHPSRNPSLSKAQIEAWLEATLGVRKVLWLPHGLAHDTDTNGHVDNVACFAKPGTVILAWDDDEHGDNRQFALENERYLRSETDACGRTLEIVRLPNPPRMTYTHEDVASLTPCDPTIPNDRVEGTPLAPSYVNFYIANGGVVVPQFGDERTDAKALQVLAQAFPDRKVVGVQTREIILGGGNIHCITQQVPKTAETASTEGKL